MQNYKLIIALLFMAFWSCQNDNPIPKENESESEKVIEANLPLNEIILEDLSSFQVNSEVWSIVGGVSSDFSKNQYLSTTDGTGILHAKHETARNTLKTVLEHQDLELEFEVLLPKNSKGSLHFMSRYELELNDPKSNITNRASGLWQKYRVMFRAPIFDEGGKKISNAYLEYLYLNNFLIDRNVEYTNTSGNITDEVATAPLMISNSSGPIAIRNIRYKNYGTDHVDIQNVSYQLYKGEFKSIPDFSKMESVKSGTIEDFTELTAISGDKNEFGIVFSGDLIIPSDGQYLFETTIDDGGDLSIDGQLVIHNEGASGRGTERGLIQLSAGKHSFIQSFYQDAGRSHLSLKVEGPEIEKTSLPFQSRPLGLPEIDQAKELPILINDRPELIRGFANHKGTKKTHILSIGTPEGIHYSYDTRNNKLINVWKGDFADMGQMWIGRGHSQLFQPLNAVLELDETRPDRDCSPTGYVLNEMGLPIFEYSCDDIVVHDLTIPSENNEGIIRKINVDKGSLELTFADATNIYNCEDGWYSIDNEYYLKVRSSNEMISQKTTNGRSLLTAKIVEGKPLEYELYW